jgi:hypothetical protein
MATAQVKHKRSVPRAAAGTAPPGKVVRRKKRVVSRKGPAAAEKRSARSHVAPAGWKDLARGGRRAPRGKRSASRFDGISTFRFALLLFAVAAGFTLYVGHVHATQDLVAEVQQVRRENMRLHLQYNRLKGEFDGATGPVEVYDRARALGLEEGIAYGPTIRIEEGAR